MMRAPGSAALEGAEQVEPGPGTHSPVRAVLAGAGMRQ
jgi:hypothetical protein